MKHFLLLSLLLSFIVACDKDSDPAPEAPPVVVDPEPEPEPEVPTGPEVTVYDGYQLLWNDEFEGSTLNLNNWSYEIGTGVNGDFGTGQLDRATDRSVNVNLLPATEAADGALAITTTKEFYIDRQYTSGRINTNGKFSCGPGTRIEARVWARDTKYKGQGFAFWMMPAEKPSNQEYIMWPQGGEIDVMEYVGAIPYHNLGSVHYAWSWENNQYQSWNHGHKGAYYNYAEAQMPVTNPGYGGWPASNAATTGNGAYHLYRIDWFADRIEFSVDGNIYHINYFNDGAAFANAQDGQDADAAVMVNGKRMLKSEYSHHFNEWKPFAHKFYLILSAGVGGNDNMSYGGAIVPEAQFPCTTLIDYVRVYTRQ